MKDIENKLFELQEEAYAEFQRRLIPSVEPERIIGVRTPVLRSMAKKMMKSSGKEDFLRDLPHRYFEENQLHAFILSEEKDFKTCMDEIESFLPYVDNWATCDQMSPKIFKKHRPELLEYIRNWIRSDETYTVRFAIGMLMKYFLEDAFQPEYPDMVADVRSDEYYIKMMAAWYFATALAKQYTAVLPYIEEGRLDVWTHNKAIQKSRESYRITKEQKEYLKTLKRKN